MVVVGGWVVVGEGAASVVDVVEATGSGGGAVVDACGSVVADSREEQAVTCSTDAITDANSTDDARTDISRSKVSGVDAIGWTRGFRSPDCRDRGADVGRVRMSEAGTAFVIGCNEIATCW